jgi:hypothetical protein
MNEENIEKCLMISMCSIKVIEILILKGFGIVYEKSMVREWCDILVIHRQ